MSTVTISPSAEEHASPGGFFAEVLKPCKDFFTCLTSAPESRWNTKTRTALLALIVIWAIKLFSTWAAWGNLTIDSGHEMYVPSLLAHGKVLYRDVWFPYTPIAPYFTSVLFLVFGEHLNVLYLAGSFSALGSAVFLYLAGMRMGSWAAGWMAGAVLLIQAFQPSLFCFPLPYSSSAVYGCLIGCCFLWLSIRVCSSHGHAWLFAAGTASAIALLLKMEFGTACYAALGFLILGRALRHRTLKTICMDVLAILPGLVLCLAVIRWMVSIAGAAFITQENIMSWPTSYFMRAYGKLWLDNTGFSLNITAFATSAQRTLLLLSVWQGIVLVLLRRWTSLRWAVLRVLLAFLALGFLLSTSTWRATLLALFFPRDTVLYVAVAAVFAGVFFFRNPELGRGLAAAVLFSFSSLLAFRILLRNTPEGYPIYYNGPAVLSLFLIVFALFSQLEIRWRFKLRPDLLVGAICLLSVILEVHANSAFASDYAPWVTDRGMIKISPYKAVRYQRAIDFMKEKNAAGEAVLSIPEDTSLYFLSNTPCPTRVYLFAPGVLAPGKMIQEVIDEIEQKHVRYLLWSNRTFPDFGTQWFGMDFDQPLGEYLRSHYQRVGTVATKEVRLGEWTAYIWERRPEKTFK